MRDIDKLFRLVRSVDVERDESDGGVFHWAISVPAAKNIRVIVELKDNNSR